MVELPLLVLCDQGTVLLLNLGVILAHAIYVVYQKRGFATDSEHLHVLNVLRDVGREMRLQCIALLHCLRDFPQLLAHAVEGAS